MSRGDADFPHPDELAKSPASVPSGGADAKATDSLALSRVPPLAYLAMGAALVHVAVSRVALSLIASNKVAPPTTLLVAAPFALNLAACAALVAFISGSSELVRSSLIDTMRRRLLISGLGALLTSTALLALFAPEGNITPQHVLVATAATHMLLLQLCIVGVLGHKGLAGRVAIGFVAITSCSAIGSILLRHFMQDAAGESGTLHAVHGLGELAYLLGPIAAAFAILPWDDTKGARRARRAGFIAVCCMAFMLTLAARLPGQMFGQLLFGTLKLEWALERASLGYALPVSLSIGAAVAALAGPERRQRQGGAGLWIWFCAGYNPLTPARLLMSALAVLLLCRAILGTPDDKRA